MLFAGLLGVTYALALVQGKYFKTASDHRVHMRLIRDIRRNKHRFVDCSPYDMLRSPVLHPQCFNWMLSFFSDAFLETHYKKVMASINMASVAACLGFARWMYPELQPGISQDAFVLLVGLVYLFTPFNYVVWNAKNVGLSGRSFGLLLGHLYLYAIVAFSYHDVTWMWPVLLVLAVVVIMASTFAFQFLLFASPILGVITGDFALLPIPFLAYPIYYALCGKVARTHLLVQLRHKIYYARFFAEKTILAKRHSIYRDFFYDFWVRLARNPKKGLKYIYSNSLITLVWGVPFAWGTAAVLMIAGSFVELPTITGFLCNLIFVAMGLVLATSFRKTRFLGQPERYIEFAVPMLSVVAVSVLHHHTTVLVVLLVYSVAATLAQLVFPVIQQRLASTGKKSSGRDDVEKISAAIERIEHIDGEVRLFSNNENYLRCLCDRDWMILHPSPINICFEPLTFRHLFGYYTGPYAFHNLFPVKWPCLDDSLTLDLVEEHNINCLLVDRSVLQDEDRFLERAAESALAFRTIDRQGDMVIFHVVSLSRDGFDPSSAQGVSVPHNGYAPDAPTYYRKGDGRLDTNGSRSEQRMSTPLE